ncbi:MAG: hypothetical protein PVF89_01445, partial [Lysobacterales bacterium]
ACPWRSSGTSPARSTRAVSLQSRKQALGHNPLARRRALTSAAAMKLACWLFGVAADWVRDTLKPSLFARHPFPTDARPRTRAAATP